MITGYLSYLLAVLNPSNTGFEQFFTFLLYEVLLQKEENLIDEHALCLGKYNIETSVQETKDIMSSVKFNGDYNSFSRLQDYKNSYDITIEDVILYYDIIYEDDLSNYFSNGVTKSFTLNNHVGNGEDPDPISIPSHTHAYIICKGSMPFVGQGNGNIPSGLSSIYAYEINNTTRYSLTFEIHNRRTSNLYICWYKVYISSTEECNYVKLGYTEGNTQGSLIEYLATDTSGSYPTDAESNGYWYTYRGSDSIDPTAISYPSTIKGGQSITLTTTKSNDIKYGGTITYTYEVQLNGGSWTSIGSTTSLTKSYTVPKGTTTFRARVKAKDNMGFTSTDYVTGNTYSVINNTAPTIPSSISVPSSVQAGKAFTVSWGTSTDADGNLAGYTLQRKLNSGTYTTIYTGSSRSYQDTIPKANYKTVTYRVQAYDTDDEVSNYKTSNIVTVINNTAPTISGSNSDLGSFTYLSPYIEYVINDVDGNTVSVSIQLDSQSIYSGTAVLGKTEFIVFPDWDSLLNGSHTITITANDGQGGITTRTYTFSKSVNANLISRERWRRLNEGNVYDVIYFETAADVVTTNNGKYLKDRINAIRSRIAALKGTSAAALAAMDSSIITERLHMKIDSGYDVKYLDTKSQYVKIGSQTVEDVLTQIESDITALKG